MMSARGLVALPGKLIAQGNVLFRDPRKFIENISQNLYPEQYRERLIGLERMLTIHVRIDLQSAGPPHLNVLLPGLDRASLTGGPNTAINIAYRLAEMGVPIRLLCVDEGLSTDTDRLWQHVLSVAGASERLANIQFASTFDPARPVAIGSRDVFLATYWTTAYRLKTLLPAMDVRSFIYLIQDFEPAFHPWSSAYAQALETYGYQFRALINEQLLADALCASGAGRFAAPEFIEQCAVFEPAVDRSLFYPVAATGAQKRLLFYARPTQPRNLFGIGFEALRLASRHPLFSGGNWTFVSIGGGRALGPMDLGEGRSLEPAPWLNYGSYGKLMRETDILLCLMLSPHTSYPVLEMSACRGTVVTNSFMTKTRDRLEAISPKIIVKPPAIEAIAEGLIMAAERVTGEIGDSPDLTLPGEWRMALAATTLKAHQMFIEFSLL